MGNGMILIEFRFRIEISIYGGVDNMIILEFD